MAQDDSNSTNYSYMIIAGGCIGMSLSISLIRYMPETFGEISLMRCAIDMMMLTTGVVFSTYPAMTNYLEMVHPIQKQLVLNGSPFLDFLL